MCERPSSGWFDRQRVRAATGGGAGLMINTSVMSQFSIDLSPRGILPCPTRSRQPKSQAGWWVVGSDREAALHFVRLPPETRTATLIIQAEGDWVVHLLSTTPHGANRVFTPVAIDDGRTLTSQGGWTIDLARFLFGYDHVGADTSTRDTILPRLSSLGDPAVFVLLGKAGLGKSPAIFKSVYVAVQAMDPTAFDCGLETGETDVPFDLAPPAEALCDGASILEAIMGRRRLPDRLDGPVGPTATFDQGRSLLPFTREAIPVPVGRRPIGRMTLALLGNKIALGAMPGRIMARYADGITLLTPLSEGVNCGNANREKWMKGAGSVTGVHGPTDMPAARLAWKAPVGRWALPTTINLPYAGVYLTDWVNSRPGVLVESLRFMGARGRSELYLAGATGHAPSVRMGLAAQGLTAVAGKEAFRLWVYAINERQESGTVDVQVTLRSRGEAVAMRPVSIELPGHGASLEEVVFATDGLPFGRCEATVETLDGARLDYPLELGVLAEDWPRRPLRQRGALEGTLSMDEATPQCLRRLRAWGFHLVRVKLPWRLFEPDRDKYDYGAIDGLIENVRAHGLQLSLSLDHGAARVCPTWLELRGQDETGRPIRKPSLWDPRFVQALMRAWQTLARTCKSEPAVAGWRLDLLGERQVWAAHAGRAEGYEPEARDAFVEWLRAAGHTLRDVSQWISKDVRSWSMLALPRPGDAGGEDLKAHFARFRSEAAARFRNALFEAVRKAAPAKEVAWLCDVSAGYGWDGLNDALADYVGQWGGDGVESRAAAPETHGRIDLFGRAGRSGAGALGGEMFDNAPYCEPSREAMARLCALGGRVLSMPIQAQNLLAPANMAAGLAVMDRLARCEPLLSQVALRIGAFAPGLHGDDEAAPGGGTGRNLAACAARFARLNLFHTPLFAFQRLDHRRHALIVDAGAAVVDADGAKAIADYVEAGGVFVALRQTDGGGAHALHNRFGLSVEAMGDDAYAVVSGGVDGATTGRTRAGRLLRGRGNALRFVGGEALARYVAPAAGPHGPGEESTDPAGTDNAVAVAGVSWGKGRFVAVGFPWLALDPAGFRRFLLGLFPPRSPIVPCRVDNLFVEAGLFRNGDGRHYLALWNASAARQRVTAQLDFWAQDGPPQIGEIQWGLDCALSTSDGVPSVMVRLPGREMSVLEIQ